MRAYKTVSSSVVILLVTVLFIGVVTVPAAAQYDAMQYRYNAAHTGDYSPVAGSSMSNGQLTWSFTTGSVVLSSPAVANGVVYVGSEDNNVYAINATTGANVWTFTTGSEVYSSPAVANGVVYVGSEDNNVYAINATTGANVWTFTTGSAVLSSPAVA
ncbi:MAG: PQQ-binding-like beta-propeller repeat protein, partial [Halobacteriota archaeon]